MILTLLLNLLEDKGVLTKDDVSSVKSLYQLSSVLEGNASKFLNSDESAYVEEVNRYLTEKKYDQILTIKPPDSMKKFHATLVSKVDDINIVQELL